MFFEILYDSFLDVVKVLPVLYLVYLLVSYLGHNANNKYSKLMSKTKKFGPIIGGMTGCIPQCGFSIVMSDLYSRKAITLGTLIAVFIATSDEALPLMISEPNLIVPLVVMIAIKLVFAILFGYIVDFFIALGGKKQKVDTHVFDQVHCHECEITSCSHIDFDDNHKHSHGKCCGGHEHESHCCANNIFLDALVHTLMIAGFLFVANLIIGCVIEFAGIEKLSMFFGGNKFIEPFVAGIVGLIPSCASSVFLVTMFAEGAIGFGGLVGGLTVGCGVGVLVLFVKNKKDMKKNMLIVALLYAIGVLVGQICNILPTNGLF